MPHYFLNHCLKYFSTKVGLCPQICIIGSGPAGFYFAQHILKGLPNVRVDMYEQLPVPFGLVRYGVAPDHPEVKNVIHTFTKTAHMPNFRFVGNVTLGKDVTLNDLRFAYHAIVLAYGCSEDSQLNIPGETLAGVVSARKFVGWYNGLPSDRNLNPDLSSETAVILGQGNVAIDIARILLTPVDILKKTDITCYALDKLAESKINKVYLVGRRGPLHVAFTIKEFREMTKLPDVKIEFRKEQFEGLNEIVPSLPRARKRLTELLLKTLQENKMGSKIFSPIFLRRPIQIKGETSVSSVEFGINKIKDNLKGEVEATESLENIDTNLVFRSIGYRGTCPDQEISFDKQKCRVLTGDGIYPTGWIGTGPIGVIISTMNDAFLKSESLVSDVNSKIIDTSQLKPGYSHIQKLLLKKGVQTVSFAGWEKVDKIEMERGKLVGKPREKIVDIQEMLQIGADS